LARQTYVSLYQWDLSTKKFHIDISYSFSYLMDNIQTCTKVNKSIIRQGRLTQFHVDISYSLELCPGQSSIVKWTKGSKSKIRQDRVTVLLHCTSTQCDRSIYLQSFRLIPLTVLGMFLTKFKKELSAITPKLGKAELWFLCTAHSIRSMVLVHCTFNKIYLQFHVDTSCCSELCPRH
jgi:hypothetical protein